MKVKIGIGMALAALMLSAMSAVAAEPVAQPKMSFGFHAGLNMANLTGDDVADDVDSRTGFALGANMGFVVSEIVTIQPELSYIQRGAKVSGTEEIDGTVYEAELTYKLDYLEVPVLVRVTVPTESQVAPFFYAGPALGLKISSKLGIEVTGGGESMSAETDMEEVKSVDLGGVLGAGLGFQAGRGTVTVSGRYTLGLMSIDDSPLEADIKNSGLSFMVGYEFPIGR